MKTETEIVGAIADLLAREKVRVPGLNGLTLSVYDFPNATQPAWSWSASGMGNTVAVCQKTAHDAIESVARQLGPAPLASIREKIAALQAEAAALELVAEQREVAK